MTDQGNHTSRHTLHVYYGVQQRWDQATLDRIQYALGRECDGFDGLQADFDYDSQDEAIEALLVVRELGVRAETGGIGEGPPQAALDEARDIMRRSYRRSLGRPK